MRCSCHWVMGGESMSGKKVQAARSPSWLPTKRSCAWLNINYIKILLISLRLYEALFTQVGWQMEWFDSVIYVYIYYISIYNSKSISINSRYYKQPIPINLKLSVALGEQRKEYIYFRNVLIILTLLLHYLVISAFTSTEIFV